MDQIKTIVDLCAIIDQQNAIIQDLAIELAQHGAIDHEEEIRTLRQKYADAIGAPDARGV